MGVVADLSTRNTFNSYVQGGSASQIRDENGGIYVECLDSNPAPWNNVAGQMKAEVVQCQSGHVFPYNKRVWLDFEIEFLEVAPWTSNDWHFFAESHFASSSTSAPWALNLQTVNGQPTMQFVYTPYGWARRFPEAARRNVTYGERVRVTYEILMHTTAGYFAVYYNGVKVFSIAGQTSPLAATSYMKIGPYRPIQVNGRDACRFYGMKVHDTNPILDGPPPPPDTDMVKPIIKNVIAPAGFPVLVDMEAVPYEFDIEELDPGVDVWVGIGGTGTPGVSVKLEGPGHHKGFLDCTVHADGTTPSGFVVGQSKTLYIAASDNAGNDADAWSTEIAFAGEGPPPPADEVGDYVTATRADFTSVEDGITIVESEINGLEAQLAIVSAGLLDLETSLAALKVSAQAGKNRATPTY